MSLFTLCLICLAVLPEPSFPSDSFASETDTNFTEITDEADDAFNDDLDDDDIEQKPPLRFILTLNKLLTIKEIVLQNTYYMLMQPFICLAFLN